jgi:hypothetical protein
MQTHTRLTRCSFWHNICQCRHSQGSRGVYSGKTSANADTHKAHEVFILTQHLPMQTHTRLTRCLFWQNICQCRHTQGSGGVHSDTTSANADTHKAHEVFILAKHLPMQTLTRLTRCSFWHNICQCRHSQGSRGVHSDTTSANRVEINFTLRQSRSENTFGLVAAILLVLMTSTQLILCCVTNTQMF